MNHNANATAAPSGSTAWESLTPGFGNPVHDSQATFRVLLNALARPGRIGELPSVPAAGAAPVGACAALYTLCDYLTPVWLQRPDPALSAALRFHTGAPLCNAPGEATFAWIDDAQSVPAPAAFALGDAESPEHSTTLLIRVDSFTDGVPLRLSGPGIRTTETVAPFGLRADFWSERAALASVFPCGIDCFLICGSRVLGLPRTTLIEVA